MGQKIPNDIIHIVRYLKWKNEKKQLNKIYRYRFGYSYGHGSIVFGKEIDLLFYVCNNVYLNDRRYTNGKWSWNSICNFMNKKKVGKIPKNY